MFFYFAKVFSVTHGFNPNNSSGERQDKETSTVEYYQCENCGFCLSKTHALMSPEIFSRVNNIFHGSYHNTNVCPDDLHWKERLKEQSDLIADLYKIGLLDTSKPWLDYACGDGFLSNQLALHHQLHLEKYDRYEPNTIGYLTDQNLIPQSFNFVVTTSVFEHLTKREHFDEINSLVSENGVMGLHTMVRETIPCDPAWFYLLPVHCAFHTNKSMSLLFDQWEYQCSVYHVESRIWFWFKTNPEKVERIVQEANKRFNVPQYIFKHGFVDYWKE
jgi:hypothetical protein